MSRGRLSFGDIFITFPILTILAALVLVCLFWLGVALLLLYPVCWLLVAAGRWLIRWEARRG